MCEPEPSVRRTFAIIVTRPSLSHHITETNLGLETRDSSEENPFPTGRFPLFDREEAYLPVYVPSLTSHTHQDTRSSRLLLGLWHSSHNGRLGLSSFADDYRTGRGNGRSEVAYMLRKDILRGIGPS